MNLTGIHHLTAVTANAPGNKNFYTQTLGLRLVKQTVNQDDTTAYHLFYADGKGSPGTDITFFDWPAAREKRGTNAIVRTGFRIAESSFAYWKARLDELAVPNGGIVQRDGRTTIDFEDLEGQRLSLIADDDRHTPQPWDRSPVPAEHQIRGLGPITLSVPDLDATDAIVTTVLNMKKTREYTNVSSNGDATEATVHVYALDETAGPSAELHIAVEPHLSNTGHGAGGVHHVAFRVPTFADYDAWIERLAKYNVRNSGPVDRYYFRSLYFREPNGILFELATDEPGFAADEPMETLGEKLALPPFLEPHRKAIEAGLQPL